MATNPNLARALAAMQTAQRSQGYQGSDPDIKSEWDKYNAGARARDAARGFSPTTQMPSGGGTTSPRPDPIFGDYGAQADTPTTQPKRRGNSEGQRTMPSGSRSAGEPFDGQPLSTILSALALSPYQEDRRVTGMTRRPDPAYGPMDGPLSRGIQEFAGLFGVGPQAPQYDYQTEPVFRSPVAERAYNSYNPYGVLFSDPVRTGTYPYYGARPEMIPSVDAYGNRFGTFQGY